MKTCDSLRMEVFKGEWFTCSWKITNTGRVAFPRQTKLSRVRAAGVLSRGTRRAPRMNDPGGADSAWSLFAKPRMPDRETGSTPGRGIVTGLGGVIIAFLIRSCGTRNESKLGCVASSTHGKIGSSDASRGSLSW